MPVYEQPVFSYFATLHHSVGASWVGSEPRALIVRSGLPRYSMVRLQILLRTATGLLARRARLPASARVCIAPLRWTPWCSVGCIAFDPMYATKTYLRCAAQSGSVFTMRNLGWNQGQSQGNGALKGV